MREQIENHSRVVTVEKAGLAGITNRELFAAMAMQGMLTNGCMTECGQRGYAPDTIAKYAVMQADALIEELKKS